MASLVAATPGPRTWSLIHMADDRIGLTDGAITFVPVEQNLPDLPTCQIERRGDMIKDMVGADVALKRIILNGAIHPAYGIGPIDPNQGGDVNADYNTLMVNKVASERRLGPYITEGIFARSVVTCKGIFYFRWLCQESGDKGEIFSTRWTHSTPGTVQRLNTAALKTDPSSTNAGASYIVWPPIGDAVSYGADCLNRFGFPAGLTLTWSARTLGINEFEYSINPPPPPPTPTPFSSNSIPTIINEGNRARMDRFRASFDPNNALQSTIYKEEGDLMQILEFFCYYHAGDIYPPGQDPIPDRKSAVMVTTDEVVFKICCDLGLPCIYTGGKSIDPVTGLHVSGYGAYKFYNPVLDRTIAFKNKLMNTFNNKKGINDIQIQLLRDIKWSQEGRPNKNIYYYKQSVQGRPSRTTGMRVCFRPPQSNIATYNAGIDGLIANITRLNEDLNNKLTTAMDAIDRAIEDDDTDSNIAEIIKGFDVSTGDNLTPLYLDKTKSKTSVDRDEVSVVYNCIDIGLCTQLTILSGKLAGGGKLTGGNNPSWDEVKEEFNIMNEEYVDGSDLPDNEFTIDNFDRLTNSLTNYEYNVLVIIGTYLSVNIAQFIYGNIQSVTVDPEEEKKKQGYALMTACTLCINIYSYYASLVSLVDEAFPQDDDTELNTYNSIANIDELCEFSLLKEAIDNTLGLIGFNPSVAPTTRFSINERGYIIIQPSPEIAGILNQIILADVIPRFPSDAAEDPPPPVFSSLKAQPPQLYREVSLPGYPGKATVPFTVYTGKAPPPPTLSHEVSFDNPFDKSRLKLRPSLKQSVLTPEETKKKLLNSATAKRKMDKQNATNARRKMSAPSFGGKKRTKKNKRSKKIKKSKSKKNKTKRKTI
jgi:hypothetical protein